MPDQQSHANGEHSGFGDCGCGDCWPDDPVGISTHAFDMDAAILEDAKAKLVYIRDEPVFELLLPSEADALLRALERAE